MLAHIVLITLGYAAGSSLGLWGTIVDFVVNYPGMLLALAGTAALVMVVVTSVKRPAGGCATSRGTSPPLRLPRRRARAAPPAVDRHRLPVLPRPRRSSGGACTSCVPARCSSSGSGCRCGARCGSPLRVLDVSAEAPGVTTVTVGGRGSAPDAGARRAVLPVALRRRPGWTRGQPVLALGAPPTGGPCGSPRPTLGDGSARLATLRPGTRVLIEGPYGRCTTECAPAARCSCWAAGIGITPMRALLEELDQAPGDVTVVLPGALAARCRAGRGDRRRSPRPAAPATCSVEGPRVPDRNSWLPAQAAPPRPTFRRCARSCPTSRTTTSTSAGPTAG